MAVLSSDPSADPTTPTFLEYVKTTWNGESTLEGIQLVLEVLKKYGVTRIEWVCYYYSDESHTQDPEFYNDSGHVSVNYTEFERRDPTTGAYIGYYSPITFVDALTNYAQEHGSIGDYNGQFEFNLVSGELRRTADAYMPDPELSIDPLHTPESFTFGDMSLLSTGGPVTRLVSIEEWSDLTGEEREAWERWAEFAHNLYGERATFMDITWENEEAEIPSQAYAYDESQSIMLYQFDTPFWEDFRESDGSVDINRANKIAMMYARTLPHVHGFANIKEMKKRDIRVELHTIDPESGDTIATVPSERGDARAAQRDESDNDEIPF